MVLLYSTTNKMANAKGLQFIKQFAKIVTAAPGFDTVAVRLKVISAGEGKCRAEMVVTPDDTNKMGALHGGMTATLVDVVSTYAYMTTNTAVPGVSVDMHVQYLKGAKEGEELVIDSSTLRAGKRLAFLEVDIRNKGTGELVAKATHTKFVG